MAATLDNIGVFKYLYSIVYLETCYESSEETNPIEPNYAGAEFIYPNATRGRFSVRFLFYHILREFS